MGGHPGKVWQTKKGSENDHSKDWGTGEETAWKFLGYEQGGDCPHVFQRTAPHKEIVGKGFSSGLSTRWWRD